MAVRRLIHPFPHLGLTIPPGTDPHAADFSAIDWSAPWLKPLRWTGQAVAQRIEQGVELHAALNEMTPLLPTPQQKSLCPGQAVALQGVPRFVPQSDLPSGRAYEDYIFHSGHCPTRFGLHDFFNGLIWLAYPKTKRRLNQLSASEIAKTGVGAVRGPVRDALTVFDENAAFFCGPDLLWDALQARRWQELFVNLRPLWLQTRLVLFGHALLEKLVYPRKAITAHVYRVEIAVDQLLNIDAWVAQDLTVQKLANKPFTPLPVLGVPGWCAGNEAPAFYADTRVFRPRAQPKEHKPCGFFPG